jgi:hypothetical protein
MSVMKKALVVGIAILASAPAAASAQERAGDAALGALSGAIVLGPVGAVAGALVGYTAGPSIANSWGMRRSRPARNRQPASADAGRPPTSASPSRAREVAANGNGPVAENRVTGNAPPQPAAVPPVRTAPPPVQGFD